MFDPSLIQPAPPGVTLGRINAALDATRGEAQERNREQNRELLVAELRARGLMLPPPSVDTLVDLITAGPAQRQAQRLIGLAKLAGLALRSLNAAIQHQPLPSWNISAVRLVHSTLPFQPPIEVILAPDASEHLAVGDDDSIDVWFGLAAPSSSGEHTQPEVKDTAGQPVAVFRGDYQVGVLDPDASAAWRPLVQENRDENRTLTTYAARRQTGNEWRLLIGLPYAPGKQPDNEDPQT
jgi:hypothetical protein